MGEEIQHNVENEDELVTQLKKTGKLLGKKSVEIAKEVGNSTIDLAKKSNFCKKAAKKLQNVLQKFNEDSEVKENE